MRVVSRLQSLILIAAALAAAILPPRLADLTLASSETSTTAVVSLDTSPMPAGSEALTLLRQEGGIAFYAVSPGAPHGDPAATSPGEARPGAGTPAGSRRPGAEAAADRMAAAADLPLLAATARATVERVSRDLGIPPETKLQVYLLPVRMAARASGRVMSFAPIPEWAAGAAFGERGDVVLVVGRPGSYPHRDLPGVLAHEVAHVLLDRALAPGEQSAPRWFREGFAVLEARPWGWSDALALATVVLPSSPPSLSSLRDAFPAGESGARQAYAVSVSFLAFLEERAGPGAAARIARGMRDGLPFDRALETVTSAGLPLLEAEWRRGIAVRYRWIPLITSSGALWTLILVLLFAAGARRRARRRELERIWQGNGYGDPPEENGSTSW